MLDAFDGEFGVHFETQEELKPGPKLSPKCNQKQNPPGAGSDGGAGLGVVYR